VIVHRRTYWRFLPDGEEKALRKIHALTAKEVRRQTRRAQERQRKAAVRIAVKEMGMVEMRALGETTWGRDGEKELR
jgi:hypothetical protein